MKRYALAALVAVLVGACAWGTVPTVTVNYTVALPDTKPPATAPTAYATVTWSATATPGYLNVPIEPSYSATTGILTWTLPQNCQVKFQVPQAYPAINATYALGTGPIYSLNDLVPLTTPAVQPAYMSNYLLSQFPAMTQIAAPAAGMVATPTGTGPLTGPYTYLVTYVTASGETEGGSSATCTTSAQNVQLTAIPLGPAGVVARKIYRTSAAYQYYPNYLVTTLSNNTATTYLDTTADAGLGAVYPPRNTTGGWFTLNGERIFQVDHSGIQIGTNLPNGGLSGTNIAVGDSCGPLAGTAHQEIFIGNGAGQYVRNGAGDVAVGAGALGNLPGTTDDAHRRTAIGLNALWGAAGTFDTTAVGEFAGMSSSGTDGVYLGSDMGSNETRNGWLHIGNRFRDMIYGDITNGQLYFNAPLGSSFTGGATFTGNVTAPNIGPAPDLTPYAKFATSQNWSAKQDFQGGILVGGQATSDVAPFAIYLSGQGAYPSAVTNTTGGNIYLSGGIGKKGLTVVDYTALYGHEFTIYLNEGLDTNVSYTLTEGIEYSAQTSNNVTATNIAAAINAWCPGVFASASSSLIALIPTSATQNLRVSSLWAALTYSTATSGKGYLVGEWHTAGQITFDADVVGTMVPWSPNPGEVTLNAEGRSFIDISLAGAFNPTSIVGAVAGKILTLTFEDVNFSLTDGGTGGLYQLNGNFTSTAGATLVLIYTGTQWREISRSLN